VKILLITFSRPNSAGFDAAVLCFEVCWLKSMLSSYRHTKAKTSIFTYENILRFVFNLCTNWDSPISKVTAYELDDRSYTSGRVTHYQHYVQMAQGLLHLLWHRLFSPGVKDLGTKSITYFDVQLQYKSVKNYLQFGYKPSYSVV
jgi:hypothetical protein